MIGFARLAGLGYRRMGKLLAVITVITLASPAALAAATPPKFLHFVFGASEGTAALVDAERGLYQVLFSGTERDAQYFGDPGRAIQGSLELRVFLKRWIKPSPNSYVASPPNAVLVFEGEGLQAGRAVIRISAPFYDETTATLSFVASAVGTGGVSLPSRLRQPVVMMADVTMCGTFGAWGDLPNEPQLDPECHAAKGN